MHLGTLQILYHFVHFNNFRVFTKGKVFNQLFKKRKEGRQAKNVRAVKHVPQEGLLLAYSYTLGLTTFHISISNDSLIWGFENVETKGE